MVSAIVIGIFFLYRRRKELFLEGDTFWDVILWLIIGGFIGARLYHIFSEPGKYLHNLIKIFYFWEGGLGIFGALIGGGIALYFLQKKYKEMVTEPRFVANVRERERDEEQRRSDINKKDTARRSDEVVAALSNMEQKSGFGNHLQYSVWRFFDICAPLLLLGEAIGRFGNYFNQELFGKPTIAPWGIPIDAERRPAQYADTEFFHPTFLYQAVWNVCGIFVLLFAHKTKSFQKDGTIFSLYLIWYSIGRFFIEFLRLNYQPLFVGVRLAQWMTLILFVGGIFLLMLRSRKNTIS